jgi:hypothetical protein
LPQIGTGAGGTSVNILSQSVFRSSKYYDESTPFIDAPKPTSELYMNNPSELRENVPWGDYRPMDGAVEPLTIRDEIAFTSNEKPIYRCIKSNLGNGNTDIFGNNDVIKIVYSPKRLTDNNMALFIDAAKEEYIIFDQENQNTFFADDTINDRYLSTTSDTINNTILNGNVSGSYKWDNYLKRDEISATCGFVYNGNTNGTDSIAFGGLKR